MQNYERRENIRRMEEKMNEVIADSSSSYTDMVKAIDNFFASW